MIEVVTIPILMKAVDFLFGEGGKILQERRERRKAEQAATKLDSVSPTTQSTAEAETLNVIQSKQIALSIPVDEAVWKDSEAEIKHLLSLLEVYTKNYYLAKEQYAKFGSALVPPVIVHNLTEAEDGIVATIEKLQAALSNIYGKEIVIPGIR